MFKLGFTQLSVIVFFLIFIYSVNCCKTKDTKKDSSVAGIIKLPDTANIPKTKTGIEIKYGLQLLVNTAKYLGPQGSVVQLCGNKMNCVNCHLDAGIRPYANNFLETYLKYPQYRSREGMVLTIEDRINNCFERPMNGKLLPYNSREMRAIVSYIRWLCEGKTVSYKEDTLHLGTVKLLDKPANIKNGEVIYSAKCKTCHGADGQGQLDEQNITYVYPPLWGPNSYSQGSSMNRNIIAARFVKWSMPFSTKIKPPQLTDEEAFDVVSFINDFSLHPRPIRNLHKDCPDLENKPIDFPIGPYLDSFSVTQHTIGPFKPIEEFYEQRKK